jgi:hypothetical protein
MYQFLANEYQSILFETIRNTTCVEIALQRYLSLGLSLIILKRNTNKAQKQLTNDNVANKYDYKFVNGSKTQRNRRKFDIFNK